MWPSLDVVNEKGRVEISNKSDSMVQNISVIESDTYIHSLDIM